MPAVHRLLVWCFARAMAIYPPAFRDRFGDAMARAFRDALDDRRAARGAVAAAAFGASALLNHLGSGIAERRFERRRRRAARHGSGAAGRWLPGLGQDVRLSVRMMRRQRTVTLLSVLTLGVGLGAATTVFSLVDASLLRPLALPDPDRLVAVFETSAGTPSQISYENLRDWARQTRAFSALTGMRAQSVNLTGLDTPERVRGGFVTHELFTVAGVRPSLGRPLRAEDDLANAPPAVVINHPVWRRYFGGRQDVLGRAVQLNNIPFTVVGVMPPGFAFPFDAAEVWMPARLMPAATARSARTLIGFGRLRPGASLEEARADLAAVAAALAIEFPEANAGRGAAIEPLQEWLTAGVHDQLLLLFGLVVVLLAAAAANVTGLQVAAASARRGEIAIRTALGAGRRRVARQILTEHLLLAAVGGLAGIALAWVLVPVAAASAPADIVGLHRAGIDGRVAAFAAALTIATGLASALVPVWHWAGQKPAGLLAGAGRTVGDRSLRRVHAGLVCAQVAVAAVLLTTGGLLLQSYAALTRINPGFDAAGLHTLEYRLPANKYGPAAQVQFHSEVVHRVAALSGVRGAALVRALPFSGNGDVTAFRTDRTPANAVPATAELNTVTDDYFRLLNIPLLHGRTFDSRDSATAPIAVVVSRSLAAREWPNDSPIGRILMPVGTEIRAQVIGVVDDVRHRDLRDDELATCYVRQVQNPGIFMTLVAKVDGDPAVIAPAIRRAVWAVDPDQPVWKERSLASLVDRSLQGDRFLSSVLVVFAAAGLLLVAAGVYGVVSQSVARRSREIGVRLALGASRGAVLYGVLRSALTLTASGAAAGLAWSVWLHRLMQSWLYGVSPLDPLPYVAAVVVLLLLSMAACYGPARKAAATETATVLRASL